MPEDNANIDAIPGETQKLPERTANRRKTSHEHSDFLEDLRTAQEAEIAYDTHGAKGSVPYTDYRNKRLGPAS